MIPSVNSKDARISLILVTMNIFRFLSLVFALLSLAACQSGESEKKTTPASPKKDTATEKKEVEKEVQVDFEAYLESIVHEENAVHLAIAFHKENLRGGRRDCNQDYLRVKEFAQEALAEVDLSAFEGEYGYEFSEEDKEAFAKRGYLARHTEGDYYLICDAELIQEGFFECLSGDFLELTTQLAREEVDGYYDDGGFIVSVDEIASRLIFWDRIRNIHPHLCEEYECQEKYEEYLSSVITGMMNTPAFENAGGSIYPEFKTAYERIIDKHPDSEAAQILQSYLSLLEQNNFKRTKEVEAFILNYDPWWKNDNLDL